MIEPDERLTLARTLWAEARGEDFDKSTPEHDGMEDVAAVICNRVKLARVYMAKRSRRHPLFGDGSFLDCCLRPLQFSCWNMNDPNRPKLLALNADSPDTAFQTALRIADRALAGALTDRTGGATHYLTEACYKAAPDDHWSKTQPPLAKRGRHVFFRGV